MKVSNTQCMVNCNNNIILNQICYLRHRDAWISRAGVGISWRIWTGQGSWFLVWDKCREFDLRDKIVWLLDTLRSRIDASGVSLSSSMFCCSWNCLNGLTLPWCVESHEPINNVQFKNRVSEFIRVKRFEESLLTWSYNWLKISLIPVKQTVLFL